MGRHHGLKTVGLKELPNCHLLVPGGPCVKAEHPAFRIRQLCPLTQECSPSLPSLPDGVASSYSCSAPNGETQRAPVPTRGRSRPSTARPEIDFYQESPSSPSLRWLWGQCDEGRLGLNR